MIQSKQLFDKHPPHFVLLRGLSRQAVHWHRFPEILSARFPGSSCEAIDLPGVGQAAQRASPWSLAGIATDVRSRCVPPSDGRPVHLIAISLGAMVAMEWLREHHPDDFEARYANRKTHLT